MPEELEQEIKVGMVVSIPFGNGNKIRKGYVIGLTDKPKVDPDRIKAISQCSSGQETTESRLIILAAWMRENYGSTMIQALKTGSSHTGEDAGKGEEISLSERFRGRGKKNSGRTGKNQV